MSSFLVIGAGRSATTWLYENLRKCASIWLPPVKELHYFDRNIKYPSPSFLNDKHFFQRMLSQKYYNKSFRKRMFKSIGKQTLKFNIQNLFWCLKYFSGTINDVWYLSLFPNNENVISGDITPAYQLLSVDDVRAVYNLLPDAKIIFIIRDPVYRTWSQLRKNRQNSLPINEIQKILQSPDMALRNNYLDTIRNWKKYYPDNQFKLIFYDDIICAPADLLIGIFDFLSIDTEKSDVKFNGSIKIKINSSQPEEMNSEIKTLIMKNALPNLQELCGELGEHTVNWLSEAENYLYK